MKIRDFLAALFGKKFTDLFGGGTQVLPKIPDIIPPVTPPAPATGDDRAVEMAKPATQPLLSHGSEAEVDRWLGAGGAPECGGISPDLRAMLVRKDGKTWGYAPFWKSGAFLGLVDGKVAFKDVLFEGQKYFLLGWSVQENLNTVTPLKPEERTEYRSNGHGMFIFFQPHG